MRKAVLLTVAGVLLAAGVAWWVSTRSPADLGLNREQTVATPPKSHPPKSRHRGAPKIDAPSDTANDAAATVTVQGVVLAADSSTPIAGAVVRAALAEPDDATPMFEATTGADGAYTLSGSGILPAFRVECAASGFAIAVKPGVLAGVQPGQLVRVDFMLSRGARVFGRVTNGLTGAAVPDAEIRAEREEISMNHFASGKESRLTGHSGEDGSYEIIGLAPGSFHVSASVSNRELFTPEGFAITLAAGDEKQLDISLSPSAIIEGAVTTADGQPVPPDALVSLEFLHRMKGAGSEFVPDSVPDAPVVNGHYRITGITYGSTYRVSASADGYAEARSASFPLNEGQSPVTVDLVLALGSTISGIARYENDRPAATLRLYFTPDPAAQFDGMEGTMPSFPTTDENGAFMIKHVNAGKYLLFAERDFEVAAPILGGDGGLHVTVDGVHDATDLVVSVRGDGPAGDGIITGHVLGLDGAPVKGASVFSSDDPAHSMTNTDANGAFRLEHLAGAELAITACHLRSMVTADHIAPGSDITLQLVALPTVSGVVVSSNGDGVPYCDVWLEKVTTEGVIEPSSFSRHRYMRIFKTDEFGAFTIDDLEYGQVFVKAKSHGLGNGQSDPFLLAAREGKDGIRVVLSPGNAVSGRVMDKTGQPIGGATVKLYDGREVDAMTQVGMGGIDDSVPPQDQVHTDDAGHYTMTDVAPADYRVTASATGYATGSPRSVAIASGRDASGVDFRLSRGGCISGTVTIQGKPRSGMSISATGESTAGSAETEADGHFEMCGLEPGSYVVSATDMRSVLGATGSDSAPLVRRAIVEDGKTTTLDLSPPPDAGAVRGNVRGLDSKQRANVHISRTDAPEPPGDRFDQESLEATLAREGGSTYARGDGSFELDGLSPGKYTLTVDIEESERASSPVPNRPNTFIVTRAPGRMFRRELVLAPGQTLGIEIDATEAAQEVESVQP